MGYVQLEESIRDLKHQDVRVVVFMADEDPLACPSHAVLVIMFFEAL